MSRENEQRPAAGIVDASVSIRSRLDEPGERSGERRVAVEGERFNPLPAR